MSISPTSTEFDSTLLNQDAASSVKDSSNHAKTSEKRRRSSMSKYSPEFKAEVILFGMRNSQVATCKMFNVPKSTVGEWVMKAHKMDALNCSKEGPPPPVEKCVIKPAEKFVESTVKPQLKYQDGEQLLVDIASISEDSGHCVGRKRSAVGNDSNDEDKPRKRCRFSSNFGRKFHELKDCRASVEECGGGVRWAGSGQQSSPQVGDAGTKSEFVRFGVQQNSWMVKNMKCGKPTLTVDNSGWKAGQGLKLKSASRRKLPRTSDGKSERQNSSLLAGKSILTHDSSEDDLVAKIAVSENTGMASNQKAVVTGPYQATATGAAKHDTHAVEKCEACGRALAADETFTEHLVCVHLTTEGLCDICGGDSEDFVEHFKMHLKSYQHMPDKLPPMVSIKAELVDKTELDDIQNCNDNMHEGISVKVEAPTDSVNNSAEAGRWFINPFYMFS